jgi:hypothetical protein
MVLEPVSQALAAAARVAAPLMVVGLVAALGLSTAVASHLFLMQAARSRRDTGVRMALGASRFRVLSVFLVKGLVVAAVAGVAGVSAPFILTRFGLLYDVHASDLLAQWLDRRTVFGAAGISALMGMVSCLIAALPYWRADIRSLIASTPVGRAGYASWIGSLLTASEACCATVFLVCAALTGISVVHLNAVSPGFATERLLTAGVVSPRLLTLPTSQMVALSSQFFEELTERAGRLTGVNDVAVTTNLPIHGNRNRLPFYVGSPRKDCEYAEIRGVSANYFRTLGLPIEIGQSFTKIESQSGISIAVVNRTLARGCWPGQSAIGQVGGFADGTWKVVGVSANVPMFGLRSPPVPELYVPLAQWTFPQMQVVLRVSDRDPYAALPTFRRLVSELDPEARISGVRSVEDILSGAQSPLSLRAMLLRYAAICAFIVATLGTYSTSAWLARQRRRELAIRVALGATPLALMARSTVKAVAWSLPGVLLGLVMAYWGASSLAPLLFGVKPLEWSIYGGSACLISAIIATGAWLGGLDIFDSDLCSCLESE